MLKTNDEGKEMSFMTTQQAADKLGISKRTLEGMRLRGGGPSYVKIGKLVRYTDELLEQWLLTNIQNSTTAQKVTSIY
jgi:excisionase family DNA binding protein